MMSELDFVYWSYRWILLLPLVYFGLRVLSRRLDLRRQAKAAELPQLLRLMPKDTPTKIWWSMGLLSLSLLFVLGATLRPRYGQEPIDVVSGGVDLCIAFDLSKSMYAQDISPSRLIRARSEVDDILSRLHSGRVCAVAFAGTADVYPLTLDRDAVRFYLRDLTPEDMPTGGTALAAAIQAAQRALIADDAKYQESGLLRPPKAILLVTDGEDTTGGDVIKAAKDAHEKGITIFAMGIGSKSAEPIPEMKDGKMVGYQQNGEARSALDESTLRQVTELSSGRYVTLTEGFSVIDSTLRSMGEGFLEDQSKQARAERYAWLLIPAALLLLLEIWVSRQKRTE
jgi:Ca-activated chloride channel family protein